MQSHRQSGLQLGGGSAKRVVRKYRRMSLKREMRRLRRVVAAAEDAAAEAVLARTVAVIEQLEARLLQQLHRGLVPAQLQLVSSCPGPAVEWASVDLDTVRRLLGGVMQTPAPH